jgi:hypothetical protein
MSLYSRTPVRWECAGAAEIVNPDVALALGAPTAPIAGVPQVNPGLAVQYTFISFLHSIVSCVKSMRIGLKGPSSTVQL